MARTTLLAALLLVPLGVPTWAQVSVAPGQNRGRAQFQSKFDSQIVIGDGNVSRGSQAAYTQPNHLAFQAALATLQSPGAKGGTIEVLPGTYVFDQQVQIAASGVRIQGGANARIVAGPGLSGPCFQVQAGADDVVLEGLSIEDLRDPPPAGVTLVRVSAERFSLLRCRLLRANLTPAGSTSVAVRLVGARSALLEGNRFVVGRLGDGGVVPNVGEADGVCLVRATNGRGLRMQGNSFESALAPNAILCTLESAIRLEDERDALLTGNVMSYLAARVAGSTTTRPLLEVRTTQADPSIALTLRGGFVERLTCSSVVHVLGTPSAPARVMVSGNDFGRMNGITDGGVYLEYADGSVVSNNEFHNIGQADLVSPSVRVLRSDAVTLSGNSFSLPKHRIVWISECAGALVASNSFGGLLTPGTPDAYLHLDDVSDASIVNNHFAATHCLALSLTGTSGTASAFVCGNKFPRGCGPGGNPWIASGYTLIQCDGSQGNPVF
ncbi:MAG TPA: right-handed parallel beta-helix repeat-containing protein [Planctomycetota bacterium]|nr:right-handed parallel beta-helix repeat-containing protein [Planctomycetota bacterium]